jgi:hypothetical protein
MNKININNKEKKMKKENTKNWWFNEDGSLKCFAKATYFCWQSFHCAHLLDYGDCNEQLRRECWKRDDRVWAYQESIGISKDEAEKMIRKCDESAGCYVNGKKVSEKNFG